MVELPVAGVPTLEPEASVAGLEPEADKADMLEPEAGVTSDISGVKTDMLDAEAGVTSEGLGAEADSQNIVQTFLAVMPTPKVCTHNERSRQTHTHTHTHTHLRARTPEKNVNQRRMT